MHAALLPLALLLTLSGCAKDEAQDDSAQQEICDDGADNDGDGAVDCEDSDCEQDCPPSKESDCADGEDEDEDGLTDCADSDCEGAAACVEDCGDSIDNDLDGLTDCEDVDCVGTAECLEDCADGVDNDLDGLTDCLDTEDCAAACVEADFCSDGVDNDQDGLTDCEDLDCTDQCVEDCENGLDDDGDGFVDCLDNECSALPACDEDCSDGVDNDGNGKVDCEDAACVDVCAEDCENGLDDDHDGYLDCEDDECWGTDVCTTITLQVTGGNMVSKEGYFGTGFYYYGGSSGYSYGGQQSVFATSVKGSLVVDNGLSSSACSWSVGAASFQARFSYYGSVSSMPLISRSGFTSTGGCGLTSGALPTALTLGSSGEAHVLDPGAGSPLWYGGTSVRTDYGGTSTSTSGELGFRYSYSYYFSYSHTNLQGDPWETTGL